MHALKGRVSFSQLLERKVKAMKQHKPALFLGGLCFDITRDTDHWPGPNEKHTSNKQVRCAGGGATNAARCYRQLQLPCELLAPLGLDGIGNEIRTSMGNAGIQLHPRDVLETPISIVRPQGMDRSLERDPDPMYVSPNEFPKLDPSNYKRLHLDGKEAEAARYYAEAFRAKGLDVSLDANVRPNTEELLHFSTIVFASEKYFDSLKCSHDEFFELLRSKGCKFGGITMGEKGVEWFAPKIRTHTPAVHVPRMNVLDTSGAGDGFQGALLASLDHWGSAISWQQHVYFATAVGAIMVQQFGNKNFPCLTEVENFMRPRIAAATA